MNPSFDPSQLPLRDIHLPGEIAWWPLAFGWWILVAALLGILAVAGIRYWRGRRHRAARRSLNSLLAELSAGAEPSGCAQRASIVLRRFAMTVAGEAPNVAGMTGSRWADYLSAHAGDADFAHAEGSTLLELPYAAPERVSVEQAMALCRACLAWVDRQPTRA